MPDTLQMAVKQLVLDLKNFRTVPQPDELHSVQAFVSIDQERFWALMESLLEQDGYLPTENIIVLRGTGKNATCVVKDGNRRIAALKLIHGYLPTDAVPVPSAVLNKIAARSIDWKKANEVVPCAVYDESEAATVDRIVTLAHGKGEKAGKNIWTAVARARHNRDVNKVSEPALDLLEKYLDEGRNITGYQTERWAGVYPVTVLEEAMKRLASRFGVSSARELADIYPMVSQRDILENILNAIGNEQLSFPTIRSPIQDFAVAFGLPPVTTQPSPVVGQVPVTPPGGGVAKPLIPTPISTGPAPSGTTPQSHPLAPKKIPAVALNDPRSVKKTLKIFVPRGHGRGKVVALLDEAQRLDVAKTPLAFCFVLRSMFEISAKAYADDHNIPVRKANGQEKSLVELLRDVTNDLTNQKADKGMVKQLHGAMTELAKTDGILSVTSMNQLVHNQAFSIVPSDVAVLFSNIFPLLAAMNK